jgi:hypothetical protein
VSPCQGISPAIQRRPTIVAKGGPPPCVAFVASVFSAVLKPLAVRASAVGLRRKRVSGSSGIKGAIGASALCGSIRGVCDDKSLPELLRLVRLWSYNEIPVFSTQVGNPAETVPERLQWPVRLIRGLGGAHMPPDGLQVSSPPG